MSEKKYTIKSKYNGFLMLKEANTGIQRPFPKCGFTMELSEDSLKNITYSPGGIYSLENYISFLDPEIIDILGLNVEPEDNFSKEDVKELLSLGTNAQLQDALDFGNEGTKTLIKDVAIEMKISDVNKRKIISKATGHDISNIIDLLEDFSDNDSENNKPHQRQADAFVPGSNVNNNNNNTDSETSYKIVNGKRMRVVSNN